MRSTAYRRNARGLRDRQAFEHLRMQACAHGFDTDHWTSARITTVIERPTGVGYHPGHVWKLLRRRRHYRLQRPARRAVGRDEQAIARWVAEDWPGDLPQRPPAAGRGRVPGRVGRLAAAGRPPDRGAGRPHPSGPPPVQVEAGIHGRSAVLRLARRRRGPRLPPSGRRLQHRDPDRRPGEAQGPRGVQVEPGAVVGATGS
jgi:hypothetical protein